MYNGLLAHLVIWATDLGSAVAAAGLFVTLFNGPSVVARVVGGVMGDRYGKRRIILIGVAVSLVVALLGWRGVTSPLILGVFAVALGLGIGFSNTLFAPYLGDLFERENVGSLFGVLTLGWGLVGRGGAAGVGGDLRPYGQLRSGLAAVGRLLCGGGGIIADGASPRPPAPRRRNEGGVEMAVDKRAVRST